MKLAQRLMLAMGVLVTISATAMGLLTYRSIEARLMDDALLRMSSQASVAASPLIDLSEFAMQDFHALRNSPALAHFASVGSSTDAQAIEEARQLLEDELFAHLQAKPEYLQLRLLDSNGMELVRVERDAVQAQPFRVDTADLQDKSRRGYFASALGLAEGQVHVTSPDLNVEHGEIQVPHVQVMRFSGPCPGGVLVINLDLRYALDRLRNAVPAGWSIFIVNANGSFILHPDPEREFGFQLGKPWTISEQFPGLSLPDAADPAGTRSLLSHDHSGIRQAILAMPLQLADNTDLQILVSAPQARLLDSLAGVRRIYILTGLGCVLLALLLALFVANGLARPLEQLTQAVRDFNVDREMKLPSGGSGEVGVLVRSFSNLMQHLRARTNELQSEVLQRRRAQEAASAHALQMSQFHALVQGSSDAIISKDLEGIILSWNPAAQKLYGYSEQQAIGQHISLIVPQSRLAEIRQIIEMVRGGGRPDTIETQRMRSDDSLLDVQLTVSGIHDEAGKLSAVSVIARDITEEKFTRDLFRMVVEASPSGILLVDGEGAVMTANGEAERMFGYAQGKLNGIMVEQLIPQELRRQHVDNRHGFTADPQRRMMGSGRDLLALRRDGSEFPVEIGLNPIDTSRGLLVLAVVIDITDRKLNEKLLEERNRELQRSNRDLEQFAYIASHDLKEPLRMVASYTELLQERYGKQLDDKADKYIGYAREGAVRMQLMIADLLKYSRVSSREIEMQPVRMGDVVDAALMSLRGEIDNSGAQIDVGSMPVVLGAEGLLLQLMQNLLSNAIKFRGEETPKIRVAAREQDGFWEITVSDNGIGIEQHHQEKIFQMFQRLHERGRYEGSGIGLAIARKILDRMGGRIWLESVPGKGTDFRFLVQSAISPPSGLEGSVEQN